jgi:hypothetical protein
VVERAVLGLHAAEEWTIDGRTVEIHASYHYRLGDELHYVIEYAHPGASEIDDPEEAAVIALPVMRYAYQNELHLSRRPESVADRLPAVFVVWLFEPTGMTHGSYRLELGMNQLRSRL